MKIILVADHASIDFGGEAALPCHYFRVLLARQADVYLIVHTRSRTFLQQHFADNSDRIIYVEDTSLHRWVYKIQRLLPDRLGYLTLGFLLRILTQWQQKIRIKSLIRRGGDTIVHQVIPVSPKEPSLLYGLGVPVIYGPLNGGMSYPEGFSGYESAVGLWFNRIGRHFSGMINAVFPGKREASLLLVANDRSRHALPVTIKGKVKLLVDNGVDLTLWKRLPEPQTIKPVFVFVGRLVALKGVDILLDAFFKACEQYDDMTLHIIGDGAERQRLQSIVNTYANQKGVVCFDGWLRQTEIASILQEARALVLPSLHDCGGAVLLEAMASSRAVVATDWGGPADYLDQSYGFLVKPTSRLALVDGFARALLTLAQQPELAKSMGQAGRKKVEAQYDWERKIDEIQCIYRDVIKDAGVDLTPYSMAH